MCSFWKIQRDSDIWHLSSLTLHTAVINTVWSFLAGGNQPVNIIPWQKHLLWWEYSVYCNVLLGPSIKPLRQSKQGRLYSQSHFTPLFKSNWTVLWVTQQCFWNGEKMVGTACAVPPHLTSFPLHPTLTGIKVTAEKNIVYMGKHLEIHCRYSRQTKYYWQLTKQEWLIHTNENVLFYELKLWRR